ncbi:MAG: hypothetical protein JW814_00555 [Candidatus Krumholzibacteriota bacterium]|nr:hypothetical protein [Candidatus Krumholzibacteriota bacterium]
MSKISAVIIFFFVILTGCGIHSSDRENKRVGGCALDTIRAGLEMNDLSVLQQTPFRITIKSTSDRGKAAFTIYALDLTARLDSLDIPIAGRSDIIHVVSGPCWPEFSVIFRIAPPADDILDLLRLNLLTGEIGGHAPRENRPENFGAFFITAGRGSSDLWTVWYEEDD